MNMAQDLDSTAGDKWLETKQPTNGNIPIHSTSIAFPLGHAYSEISMAVTMRLQSERKMNEVLVYKGCTCMALSPTPPAGDRTLYCPASRHTPPATDARRKGDGDVHVQLYSKWVPVRVLVRRAVCVRA